MRTTEIESLSWQRIIFAALGVGFVSFLATELMHRWLVPDLGRTHERLLAEAVSAVIVSCLVAKLAHMARRQHRLTIARMQVISEMNHHIRNALAPISLSMDAIENQQLINVISEGVDRIDWALREVLPREIPIREENRYSTWRLNPDSPDQTRGKKQKVQKSQTLPPPGSQSSTGQGSLSAHH